MEKREPPPNYIRDCMEALYENENCAKFEAAFDVLNQFIRLVLLLVVFFLFGILGTYKTIIGCIWMASG